MISRKRLNRIVDYLTRPVRHVFVEDVHDIKKFPNDVLVSLMIADLGLPVKSFAELFKDCQAMDSWLGLYEEDCYATARRFHQDAYLTPTGSSGKPLGKEPVFEKPPRLPKGISYDLPLEEMADSIISGSKFFAHGEGTRKDGGKLIVASCDSRSYEFPSRKTVPYVSLSKELAANVPFTDMAFHSAGRANRQIFVRESSIVAICALFEALKERSEFRKRNPIPYHDFEYQATGIILARELGKIEIEKRGDAPEDPAERSLAAEDYAREFLEGRRAEMHCYELFNKILALPDT